MKWAIPFQTEWNGPLHFSWNGMVHSTPAGMKWSIPLQLEWNCPFYSGQKWPIYSSQNKMDHSFWVYGRGYFISGVNWFIVAWRGMDPFIPAEVYWTTSFGLGWNDHAILVSFVPSCHRTSWLTLLCHKITTSYQMQRCWFYRFIQVGNCALWWLRTLPSPPQPKGK